MTSAKEQILLEASFNPKVRTYWTLSWVFVSAITIVGIVLIPLVAILVYLFSGMMLAAMSAKLMTRKLVVKRGVFFVVEKSIPLEKITDVALSQGPIMRMFNLYQLSFETAGQSGAGALVSLVGINEAHDFREAILAQKDTLTGENVIAPEIPAEPSSTNEIAKLTQSVQNIEKLLNKLVQDKSS